MNPFFGIAATALQDPDVRQAAKGVLGAGVNAAGAGLRGLGRAGGYVGEGVTGNIAQPIFNKIGDIGNQYLPSWLSGAGSAARRGIYGLGQAVVGAEGGQGIWDALNGRNMPQQGQQGPMAAMQALGGQQGQMTPQEMMQRYYEQQIQQPINVPYANQQQEMINRFNTEFMPQMQNQFAALGAGGHQSNLFGQAQRTAGNDLTTSLEALRERSQLQQAGLNQGRLGQIGGYLGGQQGLGMQARELAQRGTIANREAQLRAMGLMQGQDLGQQAEDIRRLLGRGELQGRLAGLGLGRQFDTIQHGGRQAYGIDYLGGVGQRAGQAIDIAKMMAGGA